MAYLHEKHLRDAVRKLHVLGGPDERNSMAQSGKQLGQALGARLRPAKTKRPVSTPTPDYLDTQQGKEDVNFIKGNDIDSTAYSPDFQSDVNFIKSWNAPSQAQDYQQQNALADKVKLGGQFTMPGLSMADQNSTINGMDRNRMQNMVGMGGSVYLPPDGVNF